MAGAISAGVGVVSLEVLRVCVFFDVDAMDPASGEDGPDDVFCLEIFNTDRLDKLAYQRLVYGQMIFRMSFPRKRESIHA